MGWAVADVVHGTVLKCFVEGWEHFTFVDDGADLDVVLNVFKWSVDNEGVTEETGIVNIGGFSVDILSDAELFVSEETRDREEVEDCVMGLDTGGLLRQQGGKVVAVE